jgi:hypothetical protein
VVTSEEKAAEISIAVAADLLSCLGVPGGTTLSLAVQRVIQKRNQAAREIFGEQVKMGDRTLLDVGEIDEVAAIIFRYMRAAQEGSARLNLRLMAMTVMGIIARPPIYASTFLRYAEILATLTRDEVVAIAALYRNERDQNQNASSEKDARANARVCTRQQLVPSYFSTERHLECVLQAATRTGLVIGRSGHGALVYETSPLADELAKLASFEEALRKES